MAGRQDYYLHLQHLNLFWWCVLNREITNTKVIVLGDTLTTNDIPYGVTLGYIFLIINTFNSLAFIWLDVQKRNDKLHDMTQHGMLSSKEKRYNKILLLITLLDSTRTWTPTCRTHSRRLCIPLHHRFGYYIASMLLTCDQGIFI